MKHILALILTLLPIQSFAGDVMLLSAEVSSQCDAGSFAVNSVNFGPELINAVNSKTDYTISVSFSAYCNVAGPAIKFQSTKGGLTSAIDPTKVINYSVSIAAGSGDITPGATLPAADIAGTPTSAGTLNVGGSTVNGMVNIVFKTSEVTHPLTPDTYTDFLAIVVEQP